MPAIAVKPYQASPAGSGFSLALLESRAGQCLRLSVTTAGQEQCFGKAVDPTKQGLIIVVNNDPGKNHVLAITLVDLNKATGAIPVSKGIRGSITCKLSCWTEMPKGKVRAVPLPVIIRPQPGQVALRLPMEMRPPIQKVGQGKSVMED